MQNGKYIVYDDGTAEVFDPKRIHAQVAAASGKTPESAGFFETVDSRIQTYGLSDSLGLNSREEDAVLVAQAAIGQ